MMQLRYSFDKRVVSSFTIDSVHVSLDRRHLDLLVAIRHEGQLGRAADALSLSQSAASHRLKEAERRIGVSLTELDGRSLRLTPAAVHLAEVGEQVQQSVRLAEETARWMDAAQRLTTRIALDFYDTAPWFEDLMSDPNLPTDVDFVRVAYGSTADAVMRRRVDLGVVLVGAAQSERRRPLLVDDQLAAVVRADHPAATRGVLEPTDLVASTYVTAGDRPELGFEHHEFFEPAGVTPERLRKVESLAMVLRLVRRFGGITVQPRVALRSAWLDDLAVVPLSGSEIPVRWELVLRSPASEAESGMADAIRRVVAG